MTRIIGAQRQRRWCRNFASMQSATDITRSGNTVDKSIWAHWYNLAGGDRDRFFDWMHGRFMPKILANRGVLWAAHYKVDQKPIAPRIVHTQDAAVGNGNDYILLFGGESTHAFSRDASSFVRGTADRWSAQWSDEDRKMLALRSGVRVSIMTEEARVHGPECGRREGLRMPAPCIQLGSFNGPTPDIEEELLAWYGDWRMASLAKLPGCLGMRKMVSAVGCFWMPRMTAGLPSKPASPRFNAAAKVTSAIWRIRMG